MVRKGYIELRKQDFIFIFVILVLFAIFLVYMTLNYEKKEDPFKDFDWDEARARHDYKESTMRLVNQTGVPEHYSCKDLKFMISTNTIPHKELIYNCKFSPEEDEQWCKTHTNPNNQQEFKDYFILNCLEVKTSLSNKS